MASLTEPDLTQPLRPVPFGGRVVRGLSRMLSQAGTNGILFAGALAAGTGVLLAQEREVPKDSARVTLRGCAAGRAFVVGPRSEDQPSTLEIEPGRRLRLGGNGKVLAEIRKRERMMVEITGLLKRSDVPQQGIATAGGRVRVGGGMPQSPTGGGITREPAHDPPLIDVESYRPLPESCPNR